MALKLRIQYKAQGRTQIEPLLGGAFAIGTFVNNPKVSSDFDKIAIDPSLAQAAMPLEFELEEHSPGVWALTACVEDKFNPYQYSRFDPAENTLQDPINLKKNRAILLEVGSLWTRQSMAFELIDEPLDDAEYARQVEWIEPVLELEAKLHKDFAKHLTELESRERNFNSQRNKKMVHDHLVARLDEELPKQSDDLIAATIKLAIMRGLTKFISSTNPKKGDVPSEAIAPIFGVVRMRGLGQNILKHIGVSGIVEPQYKILEDIRKFEAGFARAYKNFETTLGRTASINAARIYFVGTIEDRIHEYGPLTELLALDSVGDIMVINYKEIYLDRLGRVEKYPFRFTDDLELKNIVSKILQQSNRTLNQQNPIVDVRLPDGSRVHAAQEPVVLAKRQIDPTNKLAATCLTIRRFPEEKLTMERLVAGGSLSNDMNVFLKDCVRLRKNIIVSGGTGSGKTTLVNCLSAFCDESHRILTIEDTAELQIDKPHVVTLETVKKTTDSSEPYDIGALVRSALRMRPERIIVGECRGAEALDMLQAMNTGHSGSMTTAHANSPPEMLLRLENMVLSANGAPPLVAIRNLVASAVDIIIQANRFEMKGEGNSRRITSIAEIVGMDENGEDIILEPIFEYVGHPEQGGFHAQTGYLPTFWRHLALFNPELQEELNA